MEFGSKESKPGMRESMYSPISLPPEWFGQIAAIGLILVYIMVFLLARAFGETKTAGIVGIWLAGLLSGAFLFGSINNPIVLIPAAGLPIAAFICSFRLIHQAHWAKLGSSVALLVFGFGVSFLYEAHILSARYVRPTADVLWSVFFFPAFFAGGLGAWVALSRQRKTLYGACALVGLFLLVSLAGWMSIT